MAQTILKKKRASIKSACTRIKNYVESCIDLTPEIIANLEERRQKLSEHWAEYNKVQFELETLSDEEEDDRVAFETVFFDLTAMLRRMLSNANNIAHDGATASLPSISPVADINVSSHVRLPKLDLPKFSGKYEDWFPFYDMFSSIIHNNRTISDFQKFQYLKASLTGEAAERIQSLELSSQNYQIAWNLLQQRYDNKRTIVQLHVRSLFELPNLTKENAVELRRIADSASKHIHALSALRRPTESWDDVLIHLLVSKLDTITLREWQASLKGTDLPTFNQFIEFLNHRCQVLESTGKSCSVSQSANKRLTHVAAVNSSCAFCNGDHLIYYCRNFLKLSTVQRLAEVRKRKLCTNCLRTTKHASNKCNSGTCKICNSRHNSLLHLSSNSSELSNGTKTDNDKSQIVSENAMVSTHSSISSNHCCVLLSTAVVFIMDSNGIKQSCRILLDSGSQANFITFACAKRLQLPSRSSNVMISGINGTTSSSSRVVRVDLRSRFNKFSSIIDCVVTGRITEPLPTFLIERSNLQLPRNIKLADPDFHRSSDIDLLVGAELFWQLLCVGQIKSSQGRPTLQKIQLGWIIAGRLSGYNNDHRAYNSKVKAFHISITNAELHNSLMQFWQVEQFSNTSESYTLDEQFCEKHFTDNVSRNSQGRIVVRLPIREHKLKTLGDTYSIALRRFYSLEKRLDRDSILKSQYKDFIRDYLSLGHMKLLNTERQTNDNRITYYLPHHSVLKPSSETTKLRVVFDGSCKGTTGVSLNDVLMTGPTIQQDLMSIILRFRFFKFAFTADITKMYRQILIDPAQTCLQRILWRDDVQSDIQTYELTTVTYGTSSAPYLATRSLKYLAEVYAEQFPIGAKHIIRDFYVDDILTGADTVEAAIAVRDQIIEILNRGLFELNKWASNNSSILANLPSMNPSHVNINKESLSRILGVLWNSSTDNFQFSIKSQSLLSNKITKRIMLSEISQLFDPIGLIGPVIIIPKLLMQEVWQLGIQWDETVPLNVYTKWATFKNQLFKLNDLSIPRCVNRHNHCNLQLHGFCDASQQAYGACIYIRGQVLHSEAHVELLCSKTRVAPLKAISLPRLELCAALLLSQLFDKVRSSFNLATIESFFWSDSMITLHWISSTSRKWGVFVANRIGEIQQLTDRSNWRHVPSLSNPADLLSRGVNPRDILDSSLWWRGPEFLRADRNSWPDSSISIKECEMPELRKAEIHKIVLTNVATPNILLELLNKFSNLNKIVRIIAYCLRFSRVRARSSNEQNIIISHQEFAAALNILCKIVQRSCFANEFGLLEKGASLGSSSLAPLSPFIDNQGLLRVGGRLKNSQLPYNACHPILLPRSHQLTRLIIQREHFRNLHAGLQGTITAVRQNFWPLSVRSITRSIIRKCITCFKCKPVFSEAKMGVLPPPRVTPSRPFSASGVDYAGPFTLREGKRRNARNHKAYICLFVCLATKAVHIELVGDLTSDSFLASLKRFVSRRGIPDSIYSDNGTNFVGASRQLSEFYDFYRSQDTQSNIGRYCSGAGISWHFIPPNAPNFGGLWEAAVKSTKHHLHRIAGNAHLTFEEFQTLLCEIEAILNSRPLTPLSSDANDLSCLTPGHFLIGDALNGFPCRDLKDVNQNRLLRWQRVEQLRQHFWSRWTLEYLNQLQQRHKWILNRGIQLQRGQLVLIKQPGLPPFHWMLGRIKDVHPGSDGIARSATVTTSKGTLVRPLARLSILPLDT